ncbi:50S ribosomal protein L35 [Patescibacteria group bacterium]|jgi:large subunit ribosomal protein L35|nr:50S ribosomal protein L35 [Candidatus Uhrbacteria bacterium]MCK9361513.1 50S ribosomal protein L35 [Patescibacteria group bacterium]
MKQKTSKTVAKRMKMTKSGKLLKRKGGQGHFNSRESGNTTRNKRRDLEVSGSYTRNIKQLMPHA